MPLLDLSPDQLLSTTRAVRKRMDYSRPVEIEVIKECLDLALQAPSGSNIQGWQFVVVTDSEKKQRIAEYYRKGLVAYRDTIAFGSGRLQEVPTNVEKQDSVPVSLADIAPGFEKTPVYVIACVKGRVETAAPENAVFTQASTYGSIFPAVWSFMLAARSRGLGTCLTTLHLIYEKEVAEILRIPFEQYTQAALITLGYTLGTDFKPAPRKPLEKVLHLEVW